MDRLKELVASMDANGVDSPYLDRLRAKVQRRVATKGEAGLDALRREILAEMAASLGRAEDHINEALLRLDVLGRELDELDATSEAHREKVGEFNAARKLAHRRIWELTVQRECLGIRRHDILNELYPVPPER